MVLFRVLFCLGGGTSVCPPRAICPLAPCPHHPLGCSQGPQRAHLLPHDARFSLEPKVGLLFIPELSLVLSFDVLDLPVFIFFNLLLGFLKFPKLLSNIFLGLA